MAADLFCHPLELVPSYYPDHLYKNNGILLPQLEQKDLALIGNRKISRDAYYLWLANYGSKSYLFNKFINDKLILLKAESLGIPTEGSEADRYLLPGAIIASEWSIPHSEIMERFEQSFGKKGKKFLVDQIFIKMQPQNITMADPRYNEELEKVKYRGKNLLGEVKREVTRKGLSFFDTLVERYKSNKDSLLSAGRIPENSGFLYGSDFLEAVENLKINEVSSILESDGGLHLLKKIENESESHNMFHIYYPIDYFNIVDNKKMELETQKAYQKIKTVETRLSKGESFSQVAAEESEDYNIEFGLDQKDGWDNPWDRIFGDELLKLKKGEQSSILESDKGFHILLVKDIKNTELTTGIKEDSKKAIAYEIAVSQYKEFVEWLRADYNLISYGY